MASVSQPKQYSPDECEMKSNVLTGYSVSNAALPHPHITIPKTNNNENNVNKQQRQQQTQSPLPSSTEILTSIRNKVNKFSISTRKLRSISMKNPKLTKSKSNSVAGTPNNGSSNEDNNDNDNIDDEDNKSLKQKMKNINLFNRIKSKSSPPSPRSDDNDDDNKENNDNKTHFSYSDNEFISNNSNKNKIKHRLNANNIKMRNNNKERQFDEKQQETQNEININENINNDEAYDGDMDDEKDKNMKKKKNKYEFKKVEIPTISFQFLKNIDTKPMKSIVSQSQQSINNFMKKQQVKIQNKATTIRSNRVASGSSVSFLKQIPQKSLEQWKKSAEYELNRFAKMSAQSTYKPFNSKNNNDDGSDYFSNSEQIRWEDRIMTDIIRAGKLFVCGDVSEVFEFPSFKSNSEKQELVRTTIHYLESAVQECVTSLLGSNNNTNTKSLHKDAAKEISVKTVRQSLISLCQEFVNDPYFKYLKQSCDKYNLQPVDIGLVGSQDIKSIKSWTPRLCIYMASNRIYTHCVRVFQCYQLSGIEAIETNIYFGFKRTYSVDCLGGPPIILPPIFLSHDKDRQIAYQISIPKDKIIDTIHADIFIPDSNDFIPDQEQ